MINCHELIEFCLDYLEGELPRDEEAGFRRHLAQCPDCVNFFETYRKTPEISREALSAQIPVSVRESIRSFLASRRYAEAARRYADRSASAHPPRPDVAAACFIFDRV